RLRSAGRVWERGVVLREGAGEGAWALADAGRCGVHVTGAQAAVRDVEERAEVGGWHRLAEVEALAECAADVAQDGELFSGLDALRDARDVQASGHVDDAREQRLGSLAACVARRTHFGSIGSGQVGDEALVDLEDVERDS